ncbi:MAG: DUF1569 domain-containing protein [Phycisphaerales bacterium]|nr:DUF1569 domain-containing protein [Phycisphaerales bacterium]
MTVAFSKTDTVAESDAAQNPPADRIGRARRRLSFADLTGIMPEVARLRRGHRTVGQWTLAQMCRHLADSFHGSIDGFGTNRHRIMRVFIGRRALRRVFAANGIGAGFTVTERLNPPSDAALDPSAADLDAAIRRFLAHCGPWDVHPFFGRLTREEWTRLHRIHSAHHLSFAIPTGEPAASPSGPTLFFA